MAAPTPAPRERAGSGVLFGAVHSTSSRRVDPRYSPAVGTPTNLARWANWRLRVLLRHRVERVFVGSRDWTRGVDGVLNQVEVVRDHVGDDASDPRRALHRRSRLATHRRPSSPPALWRRSGQKPTVSAASHPCAGDTTASRPTPPGPTTAAPMARTTGPPLTATPTTSRPHAEASRSPEVCDRTEESALEEARPMWRPATSCRPTRRSRCPAGRGWAVLREPPVELRGRSLAAFVTALNDAPRYGGDESCTAQEGHRPPDRLPVRRRPHPADRGDRERLWLRRQRRAATHRPGLVARGLGRAADS